MWVHLGLFGPRRVSIDEDGKSLPLPAKLIENEYSLLDLTDFVLIDPVSTGFSRADDPKDAKLFHGLEEDIQSVGDFIRAYVTKYERGASPTYIAGESYGTTRAAGLASYLQNKGGVKVSGIVLISAVLDFQTVEYGPGNDVPYGLFLPTFTASAWYHKKLDKAWAGDLATALEESQHFADGPYARALRKGNTLTEDELRSTAKALAKYSGLSEEYVLSVNLRVKDNPFRSELLRDSKEVVGRLDTRIKAPAKGGAKGGKGGGGGGGDRLCPCFPALMGI
jgi:carboxypeptidase C (cathepsin A)